MGDPTPRIIYDDQRVKFAWRVGYMYPLGLGGETSVQLRNPSNGSAFSIGVQASVDPSNGAFLFGPTFRKNGLGWALVATKGSVTPQVSVGGLSYLHGTGVCAGFLCAGAGGVTFMNPKGMALALVIKTIAGIITMEREDSGLAILAGIVSDFNPISSIMSMLSVLSIPLGRGPKARSIETRSDREQYRAAIRKLIDGNGHADAVRRLREALKFQQNPVVEAELRSMIDMAYYKRNSSALPFGQTIEGSIRKSVKSLTAFRTKYSKWLKDGSKPAPSLKEIRSFMAQSLYLAKKMKFTFKQKKTKSGIVRKITQSAPFHITDPKLALAYAEAMSAVFVAASDPKSGLAKHIKGMTELHYDFLLTQVGKGKKEKAPKSWMRIGSYYVNLPESARKSRLDPELALIAEARHAWQLEWIESMRSLYSEGFFHLRMRHLRYIVESKTKGNAREAMLSKFDLVDYVHMETFQKGMISLASTKIPPSRYSGLMRFAMDTLRSAVDLTKIRFPGTLGDATLLLDWKKAKKYKVRPHILDALYQYVILKRRIDALPKSRSEEASVLRQFASISIARIKEVIKKHKVQVRSEAWDYWLRPNHEWRDLASDRFRDAAGRAAKFPLKELAALRTRLTNKRGRELAALAVEMKSKLTKLAADTKKFREGKADFSSLKALYAAERRDSKEINEVCGKLFAKLVKAYSEFKAELIAAGKGKDKKVKEFFKEAEGQLKLTWQYIGRAKANYMRFNVRRIAAPYLIDYMARMKISYITPREEDECVVCP